MEEGSVIDEVILKIMLEVLEMEQCWKPAEAPEESELEEITESDEPDEENIEEIADKTADEEIEPVDAAEEYQRHTKLYSEFMNAYEEQSSPDKYEYQSAEPKKRDFSWGDEIISYQERKNYIRCAQMNSLMQGVHNPIDPQVKERYDMWKYASKFNLTMSFLMFASFMNT